MGNLRGGNATRLFGGTKNENLMVVLAALKEPANGRRLKDTGVTLSNNHLLQSRDFFVFSSRSIPERFFCFTSLLLMH